MSKYYPKEMELAKRDEVSRSIFTEVAEGRGTEHNAVYLYVNHWDEAEIHDKIPDVYEQYKNVGVDISKEPMEIYPSMHHMMGGIKMDEWCKTSVEGFLACGEVAGGVHGANRLGGNSIAEGQVFGRRAGISAVKHVKDTSVLDLPLDQIEEEQKRLDDFLHRKDGVAPHEVESKLKKLMWEKVGIFRDEKRLLEAKSELQSLKKELPHLKARTDIAQRNRDMQDCFEVINMVKTAEAVVEAAVLRKESRGAHSRTDYPDTLKEWEKNIVITQKNDELVTKVIPVIK